ncbi:MAG TPA: hypothetical protein VEQ58_07935 [Polyangiaceae bacterium]|nr:hypothetical protein [Polyangiaceae bacterium]
MRRAPRFSLSLLIIGFALGCQRERSSRPETDAEPAGSNASLDRMQFSSARRVGLQTTSEAMGSGDLQRLKQMRLWVRNRAQVPIFEEDDLRALDLAIACLEHSVAPSAAIEELTEMDSGTLKKPARELCETKLP